MTQLTAKPFTARPLAARPFTAYPFGESTSVSNPLVWLAAYPDAYGVMQAQITGEGTPSFTVDDGLLLPDHEGIYRTTAEDTPPWHGARKVTNLLSYSEDFSNAVWTGSSTATLTQGVTDKDGGTKAVTATATGASQNLRHANVVGSGVSGDYFVSSIWLRRRSGTGEIRFSSTSNAPTVITLTDEWKRFSVGNTTTVTDSFFLITIVTSGDAIDACFPQLEKVTGQANQNPSEYVPTTTAAASKYFSYENGNTVSSNVVTEAQGATLDPLPSLYGAPAYTNSLIYSSDLTNAAWAKVNTGSVALDASGITGAPATASTVTDSDAGARYYLTRTVGTVTALTLRFLIKKDATATKWAYVAIDGDGANYRGFFNPNTGVFNTTNAWASEVSTKSIGGVDWYELLLYGTGKAGSVASTLYIEPTSSSDGSAHDNTATGSIIVGNAELFLNRTIKQCRSLAPVVTAASTVTVTEIDRVYDSSNMVDTEGAIYLEVKMNSASEILSTFLSTTGSNFQLDDGTTQATRPWTENTWQKVGIAYSTAENLMAINVDGTWASNVAYDGSLLSGALDAFRNPTGACFSKNERRYSLAWTAARAKVEELVA